MRIPFLWIAPFLSLIAGYVIMRMLITVPAIKAPVVSGMSVESACAILSQNNIAMQIIQYKIDPDVPHNTVINQTPAAHHTMRPHQTMFLTVSQEPPAQKCPDFYQKKIDELKNSVSALGIKVYCYPLKVSFGKQRCLAQYPAATTPLKQRSVTAYVASPEPDPVIWPQFVGKSLQEVRAFLEKFSITPHISYTHNSDLDEANLMIIDQRPLAGSLIDFKEEKKPIVQLKVDIKKGY